MAGKNNVTLTFVGDAAQLDKTFKEVGQGAQQFGDDTESGWAKANRVAVKGSAIVVGAAIAVGTSLTNTARDGLKQEAALNQVFDSMGGTGSAAFAALGDQADDMSYRIGRTTTEIQAVQTKMGTFKGVWDDPIHGAENFARATELAFDLEAAGFGNAEGNVNQLGRALENPIEGMSALARAGVTFTDAEKEKIRALQESGDLLGAQEIILQALEGQVGGVAEATTDGGDRMAAAWGNLQDQLGRQLIPVFEALMEVGQKVMAWVSENQELVTRLAIAIVGLATGILVVNAAMKAFRAIAVVVTAVQWLMNAAFLANPIGLVVLAVVALIAIFVVAYKRSETFRNIVSAAMDGVKRAFGWVLDRGKDLLNWFKQLPGKISGFFSGLADTISRPFRAAFDAVKSLWNSTIGNFSISVPSWVPVVGGKGFSFPRMHGGGIVPGAPGTETMAILQAGERVTPASSAGSGRTVIELRSSGSRVDDLLVELLRDAIRGQGGNVQAVLGAG